MPLDNSTLMYVVKAFHGRCPYHCTIQKIHNSLGSLALTKLTIYSVVSKTYFNLSGVPLAARARSVDAAVYPCGVGSNCVRVRYHSTMSMSWLLRHQYRYQPIHLDHRIPFDVTKLSSTLKNILSCCPGFQWFAEEDVFLNWPPINLTDIQWDIKVFSQPPIVQVLPLKKMRPVIFIIGTLQLWQTKLIREKKSRKSHCRIFLWINFQIMVENKYLVTYKQARFLALTDL